MFRTILVSLLTFVPLLAMAMDRDVYARSSWEDIFARRDLTVSGPTVKMNHAYGSERASALGVCRSGGHVELLAQTLDVCTRRVATRHGLVCVSYDRVRPVGQLVTTEKVCTREAYFGRAGKRCLEWSTVVTDLTRPVSVQVKRKGGYGRGGMLPGRTLFSKPYLVPACSF